MQKDYADNFISNRSTTRRIHAPGGQSSVGDLLGFGGNQSNEMQKENNPLDGNTNNNMNDNQMNNNNNNNNNIINKPIVDQTMPNNFQQITISKPASLKTAEECKRNNYPMSDAEKVREFTFEAGQPVPEKPQLMNIKEVEFISKMIIDELLELYSTVMSPSMAKESMIKMINDAKNIPKMNPPPNKSHKLIAEQGDAFVDIWYYALNACCKKGINLSKIFDVVHNANMAKRDPKTGKFLKREDGKIIKPQGWKPPNVDQQIINQINEGSWK